MPKRFLPLIVLASCLGPVGLAHADTYCVNTTGCDHSPPNFQQALTDAQGHSGPDTVRLGSAPITTTIGFTYNSADPVSIEGTGGRDQGQFGTVLQDSTSGPTHTLLTVTGSTASTISGIDFIIPTGTGNGAISTNATISNVVVEAKEPASGNLFGVALQAGGALNGSDVRLPTNGVLDVGVVVNGAGTAVADSRIRASRTYQTSSAGTISGTVRRSELESSAYGLFVSRGDVAVENSLLITRTDNGFGHVGAFADALSGDVSLSLNQVTMIGAPGPSSTALSTAASGGNRADLTFRNSLATGYAASLDRSASSGSTANITTDYSDYGGTTTADSGAGSIQETNHLNVAPGFLGATDFHLRADSPLVDAGDPAGLASGESPTDLSGQPRILDGDGNCSPRRDIGAFEFQPGPRAPRAAASATPAQSSIGQPVTFDASASCDPDGDALTYSWAFDDGTTASGASVQHVFATPARHFATVTVTDFPGRAATATASALVVALPPAFLGITIPRQTIRVSKKGVAPVKVACPRGTVGACAGTLVVTRAGGKKLASAKFSIAGGLTRKVNVKLSKHNLSALRKAKKLKVTASSKAHDLNGSMKTSAGALTLLAPR